MYTLVYIECIYLCTLNVYTCVRTLKVAEYVYIESMHLPTMHE